MRSKSAVWLVNIVLSSAATFACACASGALHTRDEEIAATIALMGSYTIDADAHTTSEASARALKSLGYQVLWNDDASLATGERVEWSSTVGTVATPTFGTFAKVNVGVVTMETLLQVTRSYQVHFTPVNGGTRITLLPRIRYGGSDITFNRIERSRQYEQEQSNAVFQQIERLLPEVPRAAVGPAEL